MKKQILLLLLIVPTSNFIISQPQKNNDNTENTRFLNIDFTKKFNDYLPEIDLSIFPVMDDDIVDLAVSLGDLKKENNHILKRFNFNDEFARFKKNGDLYVIVLTKKSTNINEEFELLKKVISDKYGSRTQIEEDIVNWQMDFYTISIMKINDKLFVLCTNDDIEQVNQKKEELPPTLESKRQKWISTLNTAFKKFKNGNENMVRFARTENDILSIYIQMPVSLSYKDFIGIRDNFTNRICYITSHLIFEDELVKSHYTEYLDYEKIIFNIEFTCNDFKKIKKIKYIYRSDLRTLKVPFTESELLDILY